MGVALLDVNVLVALFYVDHVHNEAAHRWLATERSRGWATCPVTVNGCIRVLSGSTYPQLRLQPYDVIDDLRALCASTDHHFWSDSVSVLDDSLFNHSSLRGHKQITDAYLLGLAVRNHGRLATFDRNVPIAAVKGARPSNLAFIG